MANTVWSSLLILVVCLFRVEIIFKTVQCEQFLTTLEDHKLTYFCMKIKYERIGSGFDKLILTHQTSLYWDTL